MLFPSGFNSALKHQALICFLSLSEHLHTRSLSTLSGLTSEMSTPETNQESTKQSQRSNLTVNPDELANQVLEIDDPSQTLTSSLLAVDIPSFVDSQSPSPNEKAKRGSMETSLTSPVLGMMDIIPMSTLRDCAIHQ